VFLSGYLEKHRERKSCSHTVRLFIQAWKSWGVEVSARIVAQVAQFEKEDWRPAQLTRRNEQQTNKLRQFESLDKLWPTMVDYMLNVGGEDFRTQLQSVSSNRGIHKGIASSSSNEMDVVARKSNAELSGILTCTLGYASMLRTSGMRGLTGINAKLADFSVLEDGSVLLERWEKKLGSTRNVSKPVYVRIAPGTEPSHDPLVHIARHAVHVSSGTQVFGYGFDRKDNQDDEAYAKCPQRRFIAVLHAVAIACGSTNGLGERRLHAFRVMSENRMGALGISTQERSDFVGWASTTQATSYSLIKSRALNSKVPYVLAGRDSRDDPPHPMWKLLDEVPLTVVGYWHRVNYIAVAAKAINGSVTIAPSFQEQMDDHLKDAAKGRATSTNPVALNKRIRTLERELQLERSKRAKLDLLQQDTPPTDTSSDSETNSSSDAAPTIDPPTALKELVTTLKADRKLDLFPSQCLAALPRLTSLIDANATPQRSFGGLALSSSEGKDLVRCLYLAALAKRVQKPDKEAARSWFGFIDQQKKRHPILKAVDMKSWAAYRSTL
jgi:hypothetical protein